MSTTHGYLTDKQYQKITGKASLGENADRIISQAESIVDGLLGWWAPFVQEFKGVAAGGSEGTLQLQAKDVQQLPGINYLAGCSIEILSGAAAGENAIISTQDAGGLLTFDNDLTEAVTVGTIFHVHQLGKIPRAAGDDVELLYDGNTKVYAKTVPAALREAVAAQIVYMQTMGDKFFEGGALNMKSESFNGQYSYSRAEGSAGAAALIAPQARAALRGSGLINRTAQITGY